MSKLDEAQALVAIAKDEDRAPKERQAALDQADALRKELKVGWSKLGLSVDELGELKELLPKMVESQEEDDARSARIAEGVAEIDDTVLGDAPADNAAPEVAEEPGQAGTEQNGASGEPVDLTKHDGGAAPSDKVAVDGFEASDEELSRQATRPSVEAERSAAQDAEAEAAMEKGAAKVKKAKASGDGEARGGLTRLVESLLMDPALSYLDIIKLVIADFPKANTSARSIASVAAGMRRKGKDVPHRRPAKAEKTEALPADAVTDASTGVTDLEPAALG